MNIITNDNFEDIIPAFKESLKHASFVAIDTELTGLVANESVAPSLFDSVEERYRKQRVSASHVITCQIGIAFFTKEINNRYNAKIYSFYLCPRSFGEVREKGFYIDPQSIEFLSDHGFDFNMFTRHGIPYLNQTQEEFLKSRLKLKLTDIYDAGSLEADQLNRMSSRISKWIANHEKNNDDDTYLIEHKMCVNPYTNYLFLNELRNKFKSIWIEIVDSHLLIKKVLPKERLRLEEQCYEEEDALIDAMLGFSRVFRILIESRKPIIGHNMMLDLLLFYNQFYNPLPPKLKQYKESLHQLFPVIFDTKHIISHEKAYLLGWSKIFDAKSLGEIYKNFQEDNAFKDVSFIPHIELMSDENHVVAADFAPHDAGFDAFATGYVFIKVAYIIALKNETKQNMSRAFSWLELLKAVEPFCNKINLIRANVHCMNLSESDSPSNRPQWIVVEKNPKSEAAFSLEKVASLLSDYGTIDLRQIGADRILLAVSSFSVMRNIIREFHHNDEIRVSTYNKYKHSKSMRLFLWITVGITTAAAGLLIINIIRR